MTVKILVAHEGLVVGQKFSSNSETERKLVDRNWATFDLSGAVALSTNYPAVTTQIPAGSISSLPYLGRKIFVQDETGVQYFWNGSNYVQPGGGGAENFTDLADAPAALEGNSVLATNSDGTAIACKRNFTLEDLQAPGHATARSQLNMVAFAEDWNNPEAGASLFAESSSNGPSAIGSLYLLGSTDIGGYGDLSIVVSSTDESGGDLRATMTISAGLPFVWANIPTSNPNIANAIWNDAGVLKLSAG